MLIHLLLLLHLHFLKFFNFGANLHSSRCSKFPEWCITLTIWGKIEPDYGNHANAIKWPSTWSNYKPQYRDGLLGQHSKLRSCNSWQSDPDNSYRCCGPSRAVDTGLCPFCSALYALCSLPVPSFIFKQGRSRSSWSAIPFLAAELEPRMEMSQCYWRTFSFYIVLFLSYFCMYHISSMVCSLGRQQFTRKSICSEWMHWWNWTQTAV